jgi:tetratricopeptide (TPR) repeat protein
MLMNRNADTLVEISASLNRLSDAIDGNKLDTAYHFARSGQYAQAQREIEGMAFSGLPQKIEVALLLGKVFAQMGYLDKAAAYWNNVLKTDPENQEAHLGLAAVARRSARPLAFRAFAFVAGCLFMVLVAVSFGMYFNNMYFNKQIDVFDSHITAAQKKQTEAFMVALKQDYASISSELSNSKEALARELGMIKEASDKRYQSFTELAQKMVTMKQTEERRYQKVTHKLSAIASASATQSLALRKKAESDSRRLYDELARLEATIQLNLKTITQAMEKQSPRNDADRKW